jgi:polyisoprenyl-phosphate glycosyltransferase
MTENFATRHGPFRLSVIVPCYNEQGVLGALRERLVPVLESLTTDFEVICVNDGSKDKTWDELIELHRDDRRFKLVNLARNFGKEVALTAGLDAATGDAIVPIDADLQDPPEVIRDFVAKWREGYDTVIGVRSDRSSDGLVKRATAGAFYRVMARLSDVRIEQNAGDFRLLDRKVLDAVRALPERTRFMKGLFAWVGYRQAIVHFKREPRVLGYSKWPGWRLWNFALEGLFSFSTLPLRIWTYFGILVALFGLSYMMYIVVRTLLLGSDVPGYPSLIAIVLFVSGIQLIGIGMLGEYLGRVFIEVKQRPLYLIRETVGVGIQETQGIEGCTALRIPR